jgi:nucleotide-binding universal stress UspA family protein
MLKTILLPLDGSTLSERALPYAGALARRSGGRVVLVEAVEVHPFLGVDLSDAQIAVVDRAETNLRKAANRLDAEGVPAEPHTYYDDPVTAILDAANRHCADLIVMSTHGRSGVGRMLYGSVTDQVLRRATVPVLVVPSIVEHPWSADRPLSVLIALDGSELAEEALEAADLITAAGETQVTLLRVIEPPTYPIYGDGYAYVPFDEDGEVAAARQYLEGQVTRLRERGKHVSGKVTVGQPAGVIAALAREQHADLVVMATHGHGGLSRLLLGSVATSTLHQTTVPLLLTRPAAMRRAELAPEQEAVTSAMGKTAPMAAESDERAIPTIDIRLSALDLELIEHGLRALAHAPGYDYGHVLAAQALARRLETSAKSEAGEPLAIR